MNRLLLFVFALILIGTASNGKLCILTLLVLTIRKKFYHYLSVRSVSESRSDPINDAFFGHTSEFVFQ